MKVSNIEELIGLRQLVKIQIYLNSINNGLILIMKHNLEKKNFKRIQIYYIHK